MNVNIDILYSAVFQMNCKRSLCNIMAGDLTENLTGNFPPFTRKAFQSSLKMRVGVTYLQKFLQMQKTNTYCANSSRTNS